MKRQLLVSLPLMILFQAPPQVDQLSWISGCWEGRTPNRVYTEYWMRPEGGLMMGMSRTVVGGKATEFEFLQIRQQDSDVVYIAKPARQAEASFKLAQRSEGHVTFENPAHDFPQRIIYKLQPDGSLVARIEGKMGGAERGIDFPMKRVACP